MTFKITDKRGVEEEKKEYKEPCRVCGSNICHSQEYNKPTMECIGYLRENKEQYDRGFEDGIKSMSYKEEGQLYVGVPKILLSEAIKRKKELAIYKP